MSDEMKSIGGEPDEICNKHIQIVGEAMNISLKNIDRLKKEVGILRAMLRHSHEYIPTYKSERHNRMLVDNGFAPLTDTEKEVGEDV